MRRPKSPILLAAVAVLGGLASLGGCTSSSKNDAETAAATTPPPPSPVERGRYLVSIGSCNDCHTPWTMGPNGPEPDMTRMLSGHPAGMDVPPPPEPAGPWIWSGTASMTAFAGPWGVSFAANITPDPETGIGSWPKEMFVSALRSGKHLGSGRPILPPMPWPWISKMTDDDLAAVHAYLQSIPAISNRVPDPVLAPPPGGGEPAGH